MESREIAEMNSNLEKNATLNTDVNDVQNDVAAPAETPAAISKLRLFSISTSSTPAVNNPRIAPPSSTSPVFLRFISAIPFGQSISVNLD